MADPAPDALEDLREMLVEWDGRPFAPTGHVMVARSRIAAAIVAWEKERAEAVAAIAEAAEEWKRCNALRADVEAVERDCKSEWIHGAGGNTVELGFAVADRLRKVRLGEL